MFTLIILYTLYTSIYPVYHTHVYPSNYNLSTFVYPDLKRS